MFATLRLLGEDPFGSSTCLPKTVPRLITVCRRRTIFGRDPSCCHVVIGSEKYTGTLSRCHCALICFNRRCCNAESLEDLYIQPDGTARDTEWWIEDLDSTNGTFVNGIALRGTSCRLQCGDVVTLGTNDRNTSELMDGEWWEVERWSDIVFRFECGEAAVTFLSSEYKPAKSRRRVPVCVNGGFRVGTAPYDTIANNILADEIPSFLRSSLQHDLRRHSCLLDFGGSSRSMRSSDPRFPTNLGRMSVEPITRQFGRPCINPPMDPIIISTPIALNVKQSVTVREEYIPDMWAEHNLLHPLQGQTLTCIHAAGLPILNASCAMWAPHRRLCWEQRAYDEGSHFFVKCTQKLGKGGSARVFKGAIVSSPAFSLHTDHEDILFESACCESESKDPSHVHTKATVLCDQHTRHEVALKVVSRADESSMSAFWTELNALLSLSHSPEQHLISLIGVCFDENYVITITSYHRGGPLSKWWKRYRKLNRGIKVGERSVARILRGIGHALVACHRTGWLHLDIKENNVVFNRGIGDVDNVVLIDFGCAVYVGDSGTVFDTGFDDYFEGGTFCCMAPEVLAIAVRALCHQRPDKSQRVLSFDSKADVWSLGVMAHVFLTGRYPFGLTGDRSDAAEARALLVRIRSTNILEGARDRNRLSFCAQDFLSKILATDVRSRLALPEMLKHPFLLF